MKNPELLRGIQDHAKRLDRIVDEDPNAAIEAARALLAGEELDAANRAALAGGKLRAPMYVPPHHEIRGLKPRLRQR